MDKVEEVARMIHARDIIHYGITREWEKVTPRNREQYLSIARTIGARIAELEAALLPFIFSNCPDDFQSTDDGCSEVLLCDADVQRARRALSK